MDIEKKFATCGQYTILETLGKGGQGKVKLGQHQNGAKFALKFITVSKPELIAKELQIVSNLNHENLTRLIEFHNEIIYTKKNGKQIAKTCFVYEYCEGGELFEFIAQRGSFEEETCRLFFKQLISSLTYLHSNGIAHRDIKPENLLLDGNYQLKLTDFGFANIITNNQGIMTTILGTPGYMAPELLAKQNYNGQSVDVFASGVVLFIMITGTPPFTLAIPNDANYRCFHTNRQNEFWQIRFPSANNELRELINSMLAPNPSQRPSLAEILSHPWLSGPLPNIQKFLKNLNLRKKEIDLQAMKEKLKKINEKQEVKQKNERIRMKKPIGRFRSEQDVNEEDEYEEEDEQKILRPFNNIKSDAHSFFTIIDCEILFQYLLDNRDKFCKDILKISGKYYKFQFIFEKKYADYVSKVTMSLELKHFKDEVLSVCFLKENGDYIDYFQKIQEIEDLVNNFE